MLQNPSYYLKTGGNYAEGALIVAVVGQQEWGEGGAC